MKGVCPFNKAHVVALDTLKKHVQKCKDPARNDFACCQYNDTHWFKILELSLHQQNCKDRFLQKYHEQPHMKPAVMLEKMQESELNFEYTQKKERRKKDTISFTETKMMKMENIQWTEPDFRKWYDNYQKKPQISKSRAYKPSDLDGLSRLLQKSGLDD